jgi:glucokinase
MSARREHLSRSMNESLRFVGLDVGGTTMKAAVVDDEGRASRSISVPTEPERGQDRGLATMCDAIRHAVAVAGLSLDQIAAIGVVTPGTMDLENGIILDPPNLKPWQNVPVRDYISRHFGKPTAFENDANAAALGEFWVGAGGGARSMVLFTLGTGIGGGIILNGEVLDGAHGHGGELGHTRIDSTNPRECGCGRFGCLEAYASATSVVKRAREALAAADGGSLLVKNLSELEARDVFDAAKKGDELAMRIVDETASYLAIGAMNIMHTINPEMIVFGGGMVEAGEWFLNLIRKYIPKYAFPVPAARTRVVFARLGSDAGFIGAAACARQLEQRSRIG